MWFRRLPTGTYLLDRVTLPSGFGLQLGYDPAGRLVTVTQMVERRRMTLVYNERHLLGDLILSSPSTPDRRIASYRYDEHGRLVAVRDALENTRGYAYDAANRMTTENGQSAGVFRMRYDKQGRCVETRGADGYHLCRLTYTPANVTLVTDSLGALTAYELNGRGQVLKETHADGGVRSTIYDELGRIAEEVDPLGGVTRYSYDANGNTAAIVYPTGVTMTWQYNAEHQPILFRQDASIWKLKYSRGHLISVTDPRDVETRYLYDNRGFINAVIEPSGNTLRSEVDPAWTRVRYTDDFGFEREEHYNDRMDIVQRTEPDGGVHRFEFDDAGRIVRAQAPGSQPRSFNYDHAGFVSAVTDSDGYLWRFRHNAHGAIEQILTPAGRSATFTWDTEGRLCTWVNPAGESAEFAYDQMGNRIEVRHFDGRVESSAFDVAGREIRRTLPDGKVLHFEYDLGLNLCRIHSGGTDLIACEYDRQGRLLNASTPDTRIAFEYADGLRCASEVQNGHRVEYRYDRLGALLSRTLSDSPLAPLEFEWDRRLRIVALRRGNALVQAFAYDAKDRCIERRCADCIERLEYDVLGNTIAQTVTRRNRPLVSRSWAYDSRRNVVRIDDYRTGEKCYAFDGDHSLVRSTKNGVLTDYDYDANGCLTGWQGETARVLAYTSGNRLTRSGTRTYERDANGRVTRIVDGSASTLLIWNVLGQLVQVQLPNGSIVEYAYDALGRRLRRDVDGKITDFVWSGEQLLAGITDDVVTETLIGDFNPSVLWRGTRAFYLVNSHLGVPQEAIDERSELIWWQRLSEWGEVETGGGDADGAVDFRFPGQYADDGLYYNRFRYYDPVACQYLSADPIGLAGGANEYQYCPNPVNWIDPYGLNCGAKAGDQTVYVLEKGRHPPPAPGIQPIPPQVIYVGITRQSPHDRFSQHQGKPPGGVTADNMRIIASGPPTVPDRTAARLLEASILNNWPIQPPTGQGSGANPAGSLNNAGRPVNGGYYHSNIPSSAPPGTTYHPPSTTNPMVNNSGPGASRVL